MCFVVLQYGIAVLIYTVSQIIFIVGVAFAAVVSILLKGGWAPLLTIRCFHRRANYGVPFRTTWEQDWYFGNNPHDPENGWMFVLNWLFFKIPANIFTGTAEECRAYWERRRKRLAVA